MSKSGPFAEQVRINHDLPLPYYYQLEEILREHIEGGTWKAGQQIPSEAELCEAFSVSRTVVRQALSDLVNRGLLLRRKGKGTFVSSSKIVENLLQNLTGFYEDMAAYGRAPVTQVLIQRSVPATKKVAGKLQISEGTPVIEIERLRSVGEQPVALVTTYLPYQLCPELLHEDLTRQSLYRLLESKYELRISRGRRTIEAVAANDREAQLLQVPRKAPLILLDSVSVLEDGRPIEYFHAVHRGDRTRFEVELIRIRPGHTPPLAALPGGFTLRESQPT